MSERDWGVVQEFELAADTMTSLRAGCEIMLTQYNSAWGWIETPDLLTILFYEDKGGNKFLTKIQDSAALAKLIADWLAEPGRYKNAERYDTDGNLKGGYLLSTKNLPFGPTMFTVKPEYIIYGK